MNHRARFGWIFAFVVAGISVVSPSRAQTAHTSQATSAQAWRTSWDTFGQAIDDYRKTAKEFPKASFNSLLKGQPVLDTWEVMKKFTGQVVFAGTLKGLSTENLMDGMTVKLDLDMGKKSPVAWKHIYPKVGSVDAWKAVAPGSAVKFRATIKGVAGMEPLPGAFGYMVLLQDAEIVK